MSAPDTAPPTKLYQALLAALSEMVVCGVPTGKMVQLGQRNKRVGAVLETPADVSQRRYPMTETQYTPVRPCNAPGCEKPRNTKSSYCSTHATRLYRYGSFDAPTRQRISPIVDSITGCHNWPGCIDAKGYGKLGRGGRAMKAHRWYWEQRNGPIPAGMQLDHLCRNRRCVNPDHLEPVTPAENTLRGFAPTIVANRENRCLRGHELTPENSYRKTDGGRQCRICLRVVNNRGYARRKSARQEVSA